MFRFGSNDDEIRTCRRHRDEKVVPLIWTFAFHGAEYWCPYCGMNYDMFGGVRESADDELEQSLKEWTERTRSFLGARSALVCDLIRYKGKTMKPSELPPKVLERYKRIVNEWKYEGAKDDEDDAA